MFKPQLATLVSNVIFIDYLRNARGATSVEMKADPWAGFFDARQSITAKMRRQVSAE